jgi:hypothetical protein
MIILNRSFWVSIRVTLIVLKLSPTNCVSTNVIIDKLSMHMMVLRSEHEIITRNRLDSFSIILKHILIWLLSLIRWRLWLISLPVFLTKPQFKFLLDYFLSLFLIFDVNRFKFFKNLFEFFLIHFSYCLIKVRLIREWSINTLDFDFGNFYLLL